MNKKYFVFKLIPPRVTFAQDMTGEERKLMQEHIMYWGDLFNKGLVVIFGPVFDPKGGWGLGVIEVEDEALIPSLSVNDPVIKSQQGFKHEIYPMQVGLVRK